MAGHGEAIHHFVRSAQTPTVAIEMRGGPGKHATVVAALIAEIAVKRVCAAANRFTVPQLKITDSFMNRNRADHPGAIELMCCRGVVLAQA